MCIRESCTVITVSYRFSIFSYHQARSSPIKNHGKVLIFTVFLHISTAVSCSQSRSAASLCFFLFHVKIRWKIRLARVFEASQSCFPRLAACKMLEHRTFCALRQGFGVFHALVSHFRACSRNLHLAAGRSFSRVTCFLDQVTRQMAPFPVACRLQDVATSYFLPRQPGFCHF